MSVVIPSLTPMAPVPKPGAKYPARSVAGIEVVDLPGGWFVMGGPGFNDAPAHWVQVRPFSMGRRPATNGQFRPLAGRKVAKGKEDYPIVNVTPLQAEQSIALFNEKNGTQFGSPTEAAWEYAARGEVVHLRDVMETEGIREDDFVGRLGPRVENLFAHCLGSTIYTDPERDDFQKVLRSGAPIYGYWVYGHSEGLDGGKIWYDKGCITSVAGEAAEKRASSFNLIDMLGNVWEWVADRYDEDAYLTISPIDPDNQKGEYRVCRGGSGFYNYTGNVRPAFRGRDGLDYYDDVLGFRVAL